jgi:tetratricopeptide (TPR) repeat protein
MHDLIRLYATDTAHHDLAQDERDAALRRVVDFYTHTAHTAARLVDPRAEPIQLDPLAPTVHPQPLPDASAALAWLSAEHAALLAAQHTAVRQAWHPTVWQLAQILHPFHIRRGHRRDRLVVWLAALEAATHLADPAARIIVHRNLGDAYADLGRHEEAIGHLHQALALAEEHQDTDRQAHAHHVLALAWERRGDNQQALEHAIHALDLYRAIDEPVWEADALNMVGWCAAQLGEYESARTHCQAALTLHRDRHHPDGEADALDSLGYIAHHTGNHQHAIDYYEQALTIFHALDDAYQSADTLDRLGHAYAALGQHNQADLAWRQALQLYQEQQRDTDIARIQHELNPLDRQPTVQPLPPNQAGNENRSGEDRP